MLDDNNSKFTIKDVFLQLLFMVLFLFILMWLFPTKEFVTNYVDGALDKKLDQKLDPIYERFFSENINNMQQAGKSYFTNERLPQKVGDTKKITLEEMLANHLLVKFSDSNGKSCDSKKSYVEVTKESEEYVMKVNLSCTDQEDYILVHMGCYQYCTTAICEKQAIVSSVSENKTTVAPVTSNLLCEYQKVTNGSWGNYSDWSNWQTAKIDSTEYNKVETKTGKVYVGTNTVAEKKTDTKTATKQNKTTYTCDSSYDNAGTYTEKETCVKKAEAKVETRNKTEYANAVSSTSNSTASCDRISNAHYATGYKTNWSSYSWYDSNKAANSGWKCSSTRKVKTCNACTTYKTQWYCSYSYSSSYRYIDYYYYTCPSGCYKSGNNCYKNVSSTNYSCPSGYTQSSGSGENMKCSKDVKQTVYVCSSEYDNAGTYTKETTCVKKAEPKESNLATYVCEKGYDNEGIYTKETTCVKTTTVYKKQDQYKNVTYYRQKTRKLIDGNKYVKWSNCNDSSLINAGYSKTGKTKSSK